MVESDSLLNVSGCDTCGADDIRSKCFFQYRVKYSIELDMESALGSTPMIVLAKKLGTTVYIAQVLSVLTASVTCDYSDLYSSNVCKQSATAS